MVSPVHAPIGHFCWPELATRDLPAAKAFYGLVLGWSFEDVATAGGNYALARVEGLDVAGAYPMGPQQTAAPRWNAYVRVASADASHAKALELGAATLAPPFDVPQIGRMAFVQDPLGAPIALWQPAGHFGAGLFGREGSLAWTELAASNLEQALAFYTALFGWRAESRSDLGIPYSEFFLDGTAVGGLYPSKGTRSRWTPYFAVEDCLKAAEVAREAGGDLRVTPRAIPGVGRIAILRDPQGALFSLLEAP